jgi:hypothetical protein
MVKAESEYSSLMFLYENAYIGGTPKSWMYGTSIKFFSFLGSIIMNPFSIYNQV